MKLYRKIINILASIFVLGSGTVQVAHAAEVALDFSGKVSYMPTSELPILESEVQKSEVTISSGDRASDAPGITLNYSIPLPVNGAPKMEKSAKRSAPPSSKAIASPAAELFATARSPGAIAVGAAEGNLTIAGETTSVYLGHIDPGNHVVNRGFCSWNRARNLTVAEADRRCLAALQRQSAATEQKLADLGVDPKSNVDALVNGTDLWNQSGRAGADFPEKYKQALDKKLSHRRALIYARVEAFRNEAGQLDASGLFGICARSAYFQSQLIGKKPYSESWRWQCIALDQDRRIQAVQNTLKHHMGAITTFASGVGDRAGTPETVLDRKGSRPETSEIPVLSFEAPALDQPETRETSGSNARSRQETASDLSLDFSGLDIQEVPKEPATPETENLPGTTEKEVEGDRPMDLTSDLLPIPLGVEGDRSLDFVWYSQAPVGDSVEVQPPEKAAEGNASEPKKTPAVFSGKAITKAGGAIGNCIVTDYRRFRAVHPVLGMPARWHNGVDVACPEGTHNVYSPVTGTLSILEPKESGGGGLVARIKTKDGWTIQNMHMLAIAAKPGKIKAGDKLGIGGAPPGHPNAGTGTGAHSHYERFKEVKGERHYVNPTYTELKALLGVDS